MALLARRAALACALALAACAHPSADAGEAEIRLRHRVPQGVEVWAVGDWNGWKAGRDPMPSGPDGVAATVLHLPAGDYTYAFAEGFPDGGVQVVPPESADAYVDDDLGGRSGLIRIPGR